MPVVENFILKTVRHSTGLRIEDAGVFGNSAFGPREKSKSSGAFITALRAIGKVVSLVFNAPIDIGYLADLFGWVACRVFQVVSGFKALGA